MRWNVKPCGYYRNRFYGLVESLYEDCAPWPTSRSKKRDAMIEELSALNHEQFLAREPYHCIYEVWQNGHIEPCGQIIWTYDDLCPLHKPFVESLPPEYRYKPKAGTVDNSRALRNAFYGLSSRFDASLGWIAKGDQPKAIERILGKEKKPKPSRISQPDGPIADSVDGYRVQNEMEE
jgi:hypothetical protein